MWYPGIMSSERPQGVDGSAKLDLPQDFEVPDVDAIVQDARAILMHSLRLQKELEPGGIVLSPIWEEHAGQASVRAAMVPPQVSLRYFEGPGVASLRDQGVMEMMAEIVLMLLEDPANAAKVLAATEAIWFSAEAPVRSLEVPYKPHFKVLTLVIADLARKVGAGFTELEWIASLGLMDAFHDPESDPPRDDVLGSMRDKSSAMLADEEAWMIAMNAE